MNLQYLGDALDHWKGSLFESLQQNRLVDRLAVDAMASDLPLWRAEDFHLFARLLRVGSQQVIQHQASLRERKLYFDEIKHEGDLFLDPDTGVATGHVGKPEQYVMPSELTTLLQADNRIVLVYQHVRAQWVRTRVDAVLSTLTPARGTLSWCSYESGTVALLLLSLSAKRIAMVGDHFRIMLGRHAEGRIRAGRLVA